MPSKRPHNTSDVSSRKRKSNISRASSILSTTPIQSNDIDRNTDQDDEEESSECFNEIVMAVEMRERGTVGCSYYVAQEEKLFLMEDVKLSDVDTIEMLKTYVEPTVVLLSTRVDDRVEKILNPDGGTRGSIDDQDGRFRLPYDLEMRPSQEFNYERAKQKLISLNLDSENEPEVYFRTPEDENINDNPEENGQDTGRKGRLLRLAGLIDLSSKITVGCAGAVLTYLQRKRASRFLPGDEHDTSFFRIASMELFSVHDTMFINSDTLSNLQILDSETHPNVHNQGPTRNSSGAKEGLSMYGVFQNLACTPQGKISLRRRFLRPSTSIEVIKERLDAVGILIQPENIPVVENLVKCLKRIRNIRAILIQLRKGVTTSSSGGRGISRGIWNSLQQFAFYSIRIRDSVQDINNGEKLNIARDIMRKFDHAVLRSVGTQINCIVDFEQSVEQHRTVVKPGIDDELDRMKHQYSGMEDLLASAARSVAQEITGDISQLNAIYYPQIGFLIVVPVDSSTGRGVVEGEHVEDVWELMFVSEFSAYYKSDKMRQLDATFGDIQSLICDKEIEITFQLAQDLLQYENVLSICSDLSGELDCLLAFAQGARSKSLGRPHVVEHNELTITGGWHLLQELTVPSYVPNDTSLTGGSGEEEDYQHQIPDKSSEASSEFSDFIKPSMLIMTGPNYSGKTVLLKQIALIVYLAHIGSFVPAKSATIGLTDKILSRISTRETVSKIQSSFMIDLQQITLALSQATRRSLIIIDEFGKGTNSCDGAGLACGVFEYLLGLGKHRPRVLAATHFHEIFENGFLPSRPELAFGHMEVQVHENLPCVEDQITYLYNFRPGRSISSFGTICAALNGIDPVIVTRANELIRLSAQNEDLVETCSKMDKREMEELDLAEQVARNFLQQDIPDPEGINEQQVDGIKDLLGAVLQVTEE